MRSVFAAAIACGAALAAPHHETLTFSESEFVADIASPAQADERVRFSAALPWQNFDLLEARLLDVSDPTSPNYGEWMGQEEVNALTAPPAAARARASAFLAASGADCVDLPHSLACTAPVSAVNALFSTTITAFAHTARGGKRVLRVHPDTPYSFPDGLRGSVEFVTNLVDFPTVRRKMGKTHSVKSAAVDYSITPETLVALYGTAKGSKKSSQCPIEFQQDSGFEEADMRKFATATALPYWNISHTIGPNAGGGDFEATLDEQYIGAVGQGNDNWYFTEADWQLEWVEHLAALPDAGLPKIFSMSWGWSEQDQCRIDPTSTPCKPGDGGSAAYVAAVNKGFAAAGLRGISIIISSGDSGAHGRTDDSCAKAATLPDYPTASPYILSVGASQLVNGGPLAAPKSPLCAQNPAGVHPCAGSGTEVVCSPATGALIASGGGFSTVAPTPAWQAAAVKAYTAIPGAVPAAGEYNATGRAYPDVAALGHQFPIYAGGQWVNVDGTSCSTPVLAGIIGLANAARLEAGKKVLGFLPPAIYAIAAKKGGAFTDVTKGDNKCTEQGCKAGCSGFEATVGWDATTGWGTPKVVQLVKELLALP